MTDQPEVFQVFVEIKPPKDGDPGQVSRGHYRIKDGLLIMTDGKGNTVQDDNGATYTHKLVSGDDAYVIACRLTKKLRDTLRGKDAAPSGFSGPLTYGPPGIY